MSIFSLFYVFAKLKFIFFAFFLIYISQFHYLPVNRSCKRLCTEFVRMDVIVFRIDPLRQMISIPSSSTSLC